MLRLMFVIAEWELDRSRESWDIARERAVARGVYLGPVTPLGYRRLKSGRLKILRSRAVVIVEVFRLRAKGVGVDDLAGFLNASHLKTKSGVPFSRGHVYSIIKNRVYLGESISRPFRNTTAHEPIVDSRTWQLAQLPPQQPQDRNGAFLGGLVRCAACGYTMSLYPPVSKRSPSPSHRCSQGVCQERAVVRCDELEPLVEQLLFRLRPGDRRVKGWRELQPSERRAFTAEVFDCVYIERGSQPAIERSWIYRRGEGPGKVGGGSRCIPLDQAGGNARRLAPLRDWNDSHIKRELKGFFAQIFEAAWPPYVEFAKAGYAQVHAQAFAWGGPHYWGGDPWHRDSKANRHVERGPSSSRPGSVLEREDQMATPERIRGGRAPPSPRRHLHPRWDRILGPPIRASVERAPPLLDLHSNRRGARRLHERP